MRPRELFHVTTPKKAARYRVTGAILRPVRGFDTLQGAMAWGMKTGRSVVYAVTYDDADLHKLPDHHNGFGSAWWVDRDVPLPAMRCVFSARGDA